VEQHAAYTYICFWLLKIQVFGGFCPHSLGPVYEFVCVSFRTGNLNCMAVNMAYVPKPESGTKVLKMTPP
jgi:hypothetical protein